MGLEGWFLIWWWLDLEHRVMSWPTSCFLDQISSLIQPNIRISLPSTLLFTQLPTTIMRRISLEVSPFLSTAQLKKLKESQSFILRVGSSHLFIIKDPITMMELQVASSWILPIMSLTMSIQFGRHSSLMEFGLILDLCSFTIRKWWMKFQSKSVGKL